MPREMPPSKPNGSQHWLQLLINNPTLRSRLANAIEDAINKGLPSPINTTILWKSPLQLDNYAEYSGDDFLKLLGIDGSLSGYWPTNGGGASWDALATLIINDGNNSPAKGYLIVESKSHISEIVTKTKAVDVESLEQINQAFSDTKKALGANPYIDWGYGCYQYGNRLAHLHFLRNILKEPNVYLVFLYFVDDSTIDNPTTLEEWHGAIALQHCLLGLSKETLSKNNVIDIFIRTHTDRTSPTISVLF